MKKGGKEKWGMGDEEYKGRRNRESINLLGWHVTKVWERGVGGGRWEEKWGKYQPTWTVCDGISY